MPIDHAVMCYAVAVDSDTIIYRNFLISIINIVIL